MSLSHDLLEQAKHLANRERGKPRQASLRRAVSSAYYALFHLLTDEASRLILSGTALGKLHPKLVRSFDHGEIKQVSRMFMMTKQSPRLPVEIDSMVKALESPPSDLQIVAGTFVDLQQHRHDADYDIARRFRRSEVEILVESAAEALRIWKTIRTEPVTRVYLIALLVSKKWDR